MPRTQQELTDLHMRVAFKVAEFNHMGSPAEQVVLLFQLIDRLVANNSDLELAQAWAYYGTWLYTNYYRLVGQFSVLGPRSPFLLNFSLALQIKAWYRAGGCVPWPRGLVYSPDVNAERAYIDFCDCERQGQQRATAAAAPCTMPPVPMPHTEPPRFTLAQTSFNT